MKYHSYRYLYPPRPKIAAAPTTLDSYETQSWWGQAKLNGTCTTIYVPPDRTSFAMGRHGPDNRLLWQPGKRWSDFEQHFPGKGWYVFVGELLHSKGIGVRDTMYLFDLLVDDGEYLIGETLHQRLIRLQTICNNVKPITAVFAGTHTIITPGVWITRPRISNFSKWFNSLSNDKDGNLPVEGLVFKNPSAKLLPCGSASANEKWQHKCRLSTNHLSF